jgi:hypothetical protein
MRSGVISVNNKVELLLFIIFILAISEVSSMTNLNTNKKEVNVIKNKIDAVVFTKIHENKTIIESKNSFVLNFFLEDPEQQSEIKNYSILICIIWIGFGFIISTLFFLFALLINNKNMVDINTSSIQIVGSLKDIMRVKIPNDESVTLNF